MRPLKRDPAPSRLAFRVKRLGRSPGFIRFATLWAPCLIVLAGIGWAVSQQELREAAITKYDETREALSERPEFAIRRIVIVGASPTVEQEVRAALADQIGVSSMKADAQVLRDRVKTIGWVATAKVRLAAPETLRVKVKERIARAVWRRGERLTLVDRKGAEITDIAARADRADLPLIAGAGADAAVAEARAILAEAGPLAERIRGFVRVGERRWDVIFDEGPKVMLPAKQPSDAMAYLVMIQNRDGVLSRDLAAVDLRISTRPTLRMNPDAAEALEASRAPKKAGEDA